MKGKLAVGIILLALMQLVACERNNVDIAADKVKSSKLNGLGASKIIGIKRREPVIFTLTGDLPPANYRWKVTPMEYIFINKGSVSTAITFDKAGTYTVVAQDSITLDSVFISVEVGTGIYRDVQESLTADEVISVTPITYADSASHLDFSAITKNNYSCSNNSLTYSLGKNGDTYFINFREVNVPAGCSGDASKAKNDIIFYWPVSENKTYNLEITLNNVTYSGTFERKGTKYEFIWPYTTGVILTKKSL
jgi:hypothetical protein